MKADEMELSLELSIGGCYKNIEKARNNENENENIHHEVDVSNNNTSSKSDASESYVVGCVQDEIFSSDSADPLKKREIQALRRREAIKKREEKQKRWASSSRSKGGVHERIHLEMQQNQARVMDRERRENESCEELLMKREKGNGAKINMNGGGKDICLGNLVQPMGYNNNNNKCLKVFQNGNNCGDSELEHGDKGVVSNGLIERSSSAFLDYQSTSQKAGSSSTDTGNHSNYSQEGQQQLSATATTDNPERSDFNRPSSLVQSDQANGKAPTILLTMSSSNIPSPECSDSKKCERTNKLNATPQAQPSSTSRQCNKPVIKPPAPQGNTQSPTPLPRMPLVSTTGNSPNGKTVNGFLYSYSKLEVSIVCVCHGRSFSPAEFVEHAGGVNISHPLKHITIVPTSFS